MIISRAKSKCPEKKVLECHFVNANHILTVLGLDADEKPPEIWWADICCILFAATRCFNILVF